jgi:hypothetical protein
MTERFITVKATGFSTTELAALHELLESDNVKSKKLVANLHNVPKGTRPTGDVHFEHHGEIYEGKSERQRQRPFAELLRSEWDPKFGSYTVEVKIYVSFDQSAWTPSCLTDEHFADLLCPAHVPLALFKALGIFPEEETMIRHMDPKPKK